MNVFRTLASIAICLATTAVAAEPPSPAPGTTTAAHDRGASLLNDSLEEGSKSAPDGWTTKPVAGVRLTWDDRIAHTGKRSLRLMKSAKRYFPIASWTRRVDHVDADAEAVRLEAFVKANKAKKVVIDILFLGEGEKWIEHKWVKYIGEDDSNPNGVTCDWTNVVGTVAIPDGTKFIEVAAQMYGPGTVWIDDVKLTYASAGDVDVE